MCLHFTILIHKKKFMLLLFPKGEYVNLDDFSSKASDKEISGLIKGISLVAKKNWSL